LEEVELQNSNFRIEIHKLKFPNESIIPHLIKYPNYYIPQRSTSSSIWIISMTIASKTTAEDLRACMIVIIPISLLF
jgi:hypothetical protein